MAQDFEDQVSIELNGKSIGSVNNWSVSSDETIDASSFLDASPPIFSREITGSFSSDRVLDWLESPKSEILLYAPMLLPWWRDWWIRLRNLEWPDELIVQGQARVDRTDHNSANFVFTGPVTITNQHDYTWTAWLQRQWRRLKRRIPMVRENESLKKAVEPKKPEPDEAEEGWEGVENADREEAERFVRGDVEPEIQK